MGNGPSEGPRGCACPFSTLKRRCRIAIKPILTERLILRNLQPGDATRMFAIRSHPSTLAFQPWNPASIDVVAAFIESQSDRTFDGDDWLQLAIVERESGDFIGDLGIRALDDHAQVELGITIAPDRRQKGYAREALHAIMDVLFRIRKIHRITAVADRRNVASLAMLERSGMRREAVLRENSLFRDEFVDDVVFGILRQEWLDM